MLNIANYSEIVYVHCTVLTVDDIFPSGVQPIELYELDGGNVSKKDSLDSLKKLIERYVDNINDINQEAVFQFIEDEFSIQAKVSEIIDAYQTIIVDSEVDNID